MSKTPQSLFSCCGRRKLFPSVPQGLLLKTDMLRSRSVNCLHLPKGDLVSEKASVVWYRKASCAVEGCAQVWRSWLIGRGSCLVLKRLKSLVLKEPELLICRKAFLVVKRLEELSYRGAWFACLWRCLLDLKEVEKLGCKRARTLLKTLERRCWLCTKTVQNEVWGCSSAPPTIFRYKELGTRRQCSTGLMIEDSV